MISDHDRIERLESAVAALAGLLTTTNPHIERELMEIAVVLNGGTVEDDAPQNSPE